MGKDYQLFLYNFYLHGLGTKKIIKTILKFLLGSRYTRLIVQSPEEVEYYKYLSKNKVHFIPYGENPALNMDDSKSPEGDYLFTGGYTNRDYSLILECARLNPSIKFVLVMSRLNIEMEGEKVPDNITIYKEVEYSTFNRFMYDSFGVVVPLKENVGSSGQMLSVGAMKMSKPVIYCDISSINYYFQDNKCGIPYKMGDLSSLDKAVKMLFSGNIDVHEMGKRAHRNFLDNYTLDKRNENLYNFILNN